MFDQLKGKTLVHITYDLRTSTVMKKELYKFIILVCDRRYA